ncbi:rab gtpase 2b [Stylonychia lemnae]|uniref:Rab gtpase 2b n=1 Tax=Stylonychia lemnae TaxID=5949 RepID=A0A078B5V2_STYLE|nr:rab gtpase 2b [Stylonychia lemnae]|eukprot:CDW89880.1 rab gtpase 2b [Stylonychia lemnae]
MKKQLQRQGSKDLTQYQEEQDNEETDCKVSMEEQIKTLPYEIVNNTRGIPLQQDYTFKLIVIGNSGVGKSCIMTRFLRNEFRDDHEVTLGVEFGSLFIKMEETLFKMQIWDTAGQESFQSITKTFYRGAHAILLTYSIASKQSFENLDYWYNEIKSQSEADALIILIGNQSDREEAREVSFEEGLKYKTQHDIDIFIETSAKTGNNVKDTFINTAKMLYVHHKQKIQKSKANLIEKIQRRRLKRTLSQNERNKTCAC